MWHLTTTLQFDAQIYFNASINEDTRSKSSNGTNFGDLKRFWRSTWQNQKQIRGDRWSKDERLQNSFCIIMDICHLKMLNWKQSAKNEKVEVDSDVKLRYNSESYAIFTAHGWPTSQMADSSKCHRYHFQISRVRKTSSGTNFCLYTSQNGRCSKCIENSRIGMFRHLEYEEARSKAWCLPQKHWQSRESRIHSDTQHDTLVDNLQF